MQIIIKNLKKPKKKNLIASNIKYLQLYTYNFTYHLIEIIDKRILLVPFLSFPNLNISVYRLNFSVNLTMVNIYNLKLKKLIQHREHIVYMLYYLVV